MDEHDDRIRLRAYEIWESEGSPHGRHDDHWAQATREHGAGTQPRSADEAETLAAPAKTAGARTRVASPKVPRKRTAKSPMADAGAPGGTAGTGGTVQDQDQ